MLIFKLIVNISIGTGINVVNFHRTFMRRRILSLGMFGYKLFLAIKRIIYLTVRSLTQAKYLFS